jgi:hypothetical protein
MRRHSVRVSLMQFVTDLTPRPQEVAGWAEGEPRALDDYQKAGVAEVALTVPSAGRDEVLKALDRLAPLVAAYGDEVSSHA